MQLMLLLISVLFCSGLSSRPLRVVTIPLSVVLALAVYVPLRASLAEDVTLPYSTCEMLDGDCPLTCPLGTTTLA
jgi:hypothetical protein